MPADFWARVLPRVRERHPDAWFTGEVIRGDYAAYAVSYTHLDVYKRQYSHCPGCARPIGLPGWLGGSGLAPRAAVSAGSYWCCCVAGVAVLLVLLHCWCCCTAVVHPGLYPSDRSSRLARGFRPGAPRGGLCGVLLSCGTAVVHGRFVLVLLVVLVLRPSCSRPGAFQAGSGFRPGAPSWRSLLVVLVVRSSWCFWSCIVLVVHRAGRCLLYTSRCV